MRTSLVLTIAMAGVLAGCSSEPSEADIRKAYEAKFAEAGKLAGGLAPKFHGLKKLACAKSEGASGYNCDVEMDVEMLGMRQKNAGNVRLVKGDDGWILMQGKP